MSSITSLLDTASARTRLPRWVLVTGAALLSAAAARTAFGALRKDRKITPTSNLKVVVTGCDTGFGNLTAKDLASKGFTVFAACLTDLAIEEFKKLASSDSKYAKIRPFKLDVTKDADVKSCAEMLSREAPEGLFALVNNAGVHAAYKWELSTLDMIQKDMDVNYFGVVRVTVALLPLLRKYVSSNKDGIATGRLPQPRIVTVSSIAGTMKASPSGKRILLSHAVQVFGVTLRQEVASQGILVSLVEPFYARTPFLTAIDERKISKVLAQPEEVIQAYGGAQDIRKRMSRSAFHTHMPRLLEPKEVVQVMVEQVELWRPRPHNLVGRESEFLSFFVKIAGPERLDKLVANFDAQGL
ncbi:hypothetical protein HDU93_001977 [Gonapodya sp. JEL0774]|nr:hypothetical protein HDU93_001977 [Gonapodya sp. JEL0774]